MNSRLADRPLLTAVLITAAYVILIQILQGSFFEDYEVLIHQFILGNGSGRPYNVWVTDMDFGLIPIYSYLQDVFEGISVYSIAKTIFLAVGLAAIIYVCLSRFHSPFRFWLLVIALLAFSDDVVWINNVRIAAVLSFAAILVLFFASHLSIASRITISSVLILFAVLNRIEIPVIFITLALIPGGLTRRRSVWLPLIVMWTLTLANLKIYDILMHREHPRIVHFHNYERALYDRSDFVLGDLAAYPVALDSQQLIFLGKMLFLQDEGRLDYTSFPEIVQHPSVKEYLTTNTFLLKIWLGKNLELFENVLLNYPLKLVVLILGCLVWCFISCGKRLLVLLYSIAYVSAPLLLNLLYITPDRFISPYLNIGIVALCLNIALGLDRRPERWRMAAFTLTLALLVHLHLRANAAYLDLRDSEQQALKMMQTFKKDLLEDTPPVIFSARTMDFLPARLHYLNRGVTWYFLDANIFNYYEHSGQHNAVFFGDTYPYFPARVKMLCEEKLPLYADEMFVSFVRYYLERVHKKEVVLKKEIEYQELRIARYQLSCQ